MISLKIVLVLVDVFDIVVWFVDWYDLGLCVVDVLYIVIVFVYGCILVILDCMMVSVVMVCGVLLIEVLV